MCGIVGSFPLNQPGLEDINPSLRRAITLYLHNEMLVETTPRGKDATGLSLIFGDLPEEYKKLGVEVADKFWSVLKQPVPPTEFFQNDGLNTNKYRGQDEEANIDRLMDVACLTPRPLLHVLGHARKRTKGTEFVYLNNHPILVGNVIGVHNGSIDNTDLIYKKHTNMTPQGEVDSEVIFQLLAETANDKALDEEAINYAASRIKGAFAVMAFNREHPEKVAFFRNSDRPIEFAYLREIGLAMICSEKKFMTPIMERYARLRLTMKRDLPELTVDWRHVRASSGGIIDISQEIDPSKKVEDIFPLFDLEKLNKDYEETKTVTTPSVYSQSSNAYESMSGKSRSGTIGEAALEDISDYGADTVSVTSSSADTEDSDDSVASGVAGVMRTVDASEVLEDENVAEEETEEEEEGTGTIADEYSRNELLARGAEFATGQEAREDTRLFFNKHQGHFSTLISVPKLGEDMAMEIVHQLYPEIFSEGYLYGFRQGAEEQGVADEGEDVGEELEVLQQEIAALRKRSQRAQEVSKNLIDSQERKALILQQEAEGLKRKNRKAAAVIANMKAFIVASMLMHDLGHVEGKGKAARIVFSEKIEDFLNMADGFEKADITVVRDVFSDKDLAAISGSITKEAKKITKSKKANKGNKKA